MSTPFQFQSLANPSQGFYSQANPAWQNGSSWPIDQQRQQQQQQQQQHQSQPTSQFPSAVLPAAGSGSPQALMDALNLLQQNIGALQSLIPQMTQQPATPTIPDQLQQQQAAASVGVASVISQLAVAAANILPQAGLSPPVNGFPPANLFTLPGVFSPSPHPTAYGNAPPANPYSTAGNAGAVHPSVQTQVHLPLPGQQHHVQQQQPSAVPVPEPWNSTSPTEQHPVAKSEFKLFGTSLLSQKRKVDEVLAGALGDEGGAGYPAKKAGAVGDAKAIVPVKGTSPIADADLDDEHDEESPLDESPLPEGSYDIIEMDPVELLAEHTHFCEICGKGFKRDANLRMHMRGHGDEYKTAAALARPAKVTVEGSGHREKRFSCPYVGCKRNRAHARFQPLKTFLCMKNHYRRTHCPKMFSCSKCGEKRFSVVADLKTHEKHCGRYRWLCSCGTSFSRKDKLLGHLALFKGHRPATPADAAAAAGATFTGAAAVNPALEEGVGTSSPKATGAGPFPISFPPPLALPPGCEKKALFLDQGVEEWADAGPAVSSQSTNADAGKCSGSGSFGNRGSRNDCFSSCLGANPAMPALHEGDTEEREVTLYPFQPSVQLCVGQMIVVQKSEGRG